MTSDPAPFPASESHDDLFGPPHDETTSPADASGRGDSASEPPGKPQAADGEGPEPIYHALEDWVIDHFLPTFRRTLGGEFRWCGQWWKHGEAVSRLTALWHAWEVLRLQPGTGMATWYRDHLDHQLPILMGARGPFCQCSETAHREPREAVTMIAPGEWWDREDGRIATPDSPPPLSGSPGAGDDRA